MRNLKKIKRGLLLLAITAVMILSAALSAMARDDVKPTKVTAVSKKSLTVTAGKEFELKVKTTPTDAEDDYLKWTIVSGKNYVKFADNDRTDDEMEFKAVKAGTAKIRCTISGTKKRVTFTVKVKAATPTTKKIKAVGSLTKTVEAYDDFDLEVKKYSGLKDKYLKWTIKDSTLVRFDDRKHTGDDVEFYAKKTGTTTITCTNTKTNQKITYTIKIVPDYDDDWEDDDD